MRGSKPEYPEKTPDSLLSLSSLAFLQPRFDDATLSGFVSGVGSVLQALLLHLDLHVLRAAVLKIKRRSDVAIRDVTGWLLVHGLAGGDRGVGACGHGHVNGGLGSRKIIFLKGKKVKK